MYMPVDVFEITGPFILSRVYEPHKPASSWTNTHGCVLDVASNVGGVAVLIC
jgi:hypothetical protein